MAVDWLRLMGLCLMAAVMVMVLRPMHAQMAGLLSITFGVMAVGVVLPQIQGYIDGISAFLASIQLDAQYLRLMLKAMGIVLVTQLCVQTCADLEAPSIARRAELCGRIALLGVAMPVFMELTQLAVGVLR